MSWTGAVDDRCVSGECCLMAVYVNCERLLRRSESFGIYNKPLSYTQVDWIKWNRSTNEMSRHITMLPVFGICA